MMLVLNRREDVADGVKGWVICKGRMVRRSSASQASYVPKHAKNVNRSGKEKIPCAKNE